MSIWLDAHDSWRLLGDKLDKIKCLYSNFLQKRRASCVPLNLPMWRSRQSKPTISTRLLKQRKLSVKKLFEWKKIYELQELLINVEVEALLPGTEACKGAVSDPEKLVNMPWESLTPPKVSFKAFSCLRTRVNSLYPSFPRWVPSWISVPKMMRNPTAVISSSMVRWLAIACKEVPIEAKMAHVIILSIQCGVEQILPWLDFCHQTMKMVWLSYDFL